MALAFSLVAVGAATVQFRACRAEREDSIDPSAEPPSWPASSSLADDPWLVIRSPGGSASAVDGGWTERFRLAGTFFADTGTGTVRRAILDDSTAGRQVIVGPRDVIDDISVETIEAREVRLMRGSDEWILRLRFATAESESGKPDAGMDTIAPEEVIGRSRFGVQTHPSQWAFARDSLLEYYQEVLDDPKRLMQLFDSLKPLYDADRQIHGYVLGIEGEKAFFDDVGLQEGDIVRSVNSMPMTSKARAEYFIREFVMDRANVFFVEIERGGQPETLTYMIR